MPRRLTLLLVFLAGTAVGRFGTKSKPAPGALPPVDFSADAEVRTIAPPNREGLHLRPYAVTRDGRSEAFGCAPPEHERWVVVFDGGRFQIACGEVAGRREVGGERQRGTGRSGVAPAAGRQGSAPEEVATATPE